MDEVRKIRRLKEEYDIKSVNAFRRVYVLRSRCLTRSGIRFLLPVSISIFRFALRGRTCPRIPMEPQKVEHLDEIWFFPELKVVMKQCRTLDRPRMEAHVEVRKSLLHDQRFRAEALPQRYCSLCQYSRGGQDHVRRLFPMGLSLERIFGDMPNVPFKDEVWPKFLRENAKRVFKV